MRAAPKWVTAIQRRLAAKPEITSLRCDACGRLVAPKDWAREFCTDCTTEIEHAWDDEEAARPFLLSEEE